MTITTTETQPQHRENNFNWERLVELRKENGIKQYEMIALLQEMRGDSVLSQSTYSRWERGESEPRIGTVYQMCIILGVDYAEFLPALPEVHNG
jgi:transcriptional regulator with XRE-family HTH domain